MIIILSQSFLHSSDTIAASFFSVETVALNNPFMILFPGADLGILSP